SLRPRGISVSYKRNINFDITTARYNTIPTIHTKGRTSDFSIPLKVMFMNSIYVIEPVFLIFVTLE
ncbi:MAG: hypothetical protein V3V41_08935, partial [Candidatus Heimdallarchaeota archaeon]